MGNCAVISINGKEDEKLGVYLHWNGGRDSVKSFLHYCKLKEFRPPEQDNYGWARLCQIIGNYFGGSMSIGIDIYSKLDRDNGDNGTYIIKKWEIINRFHYNGEEQNGHDLLNMLLEIDSHQPVGEQIGEEKIRDYVNSLNNLNK